MDDLRQAWIDFLSRWSWQIFYTQTFEDQPKYALLALDRARKVFETLKIRYKMERVFVFVCAEQHRNGTYHVHGLALGKPNILELPGSLRFLWLYGREAYGICRYESLRKIGGVVGYVGKYLTKVGLVEYDMFGDLDYYATGSKFDK